HARSGRNPYLTVTLGLLLGGALGNLLDRLRLGYVVDFVDLGVGSVRWYTFNVADTAISIAILLLLAARVWPSLPRPVRAPGRGWGAPDADPGGRPAGARGSLGDGSQRPVPEPRPAPHRGRQAQRRWRARQGERDRRPGCGAGAADPAAGTGDAAGSAG